MKGKQRPHASINQIKGSSVPVSEPAAAAQVQRCEQRQQCTTTTLLVCDLHRAGATGGRVSSSRRPWEPDRAAGRAKKKEKE